MPAYKLRPLNDLLFEIPKEADPEMRVPARIYADAELLKQIAHDRTLEQLCNVATLPGVLGAVYAMPDAHEGYGFPVGGVAAMRARNGVISPGGVGYDINCGVRLLASNFQMDEISAHIEPLILDLSRSIPAGTGRGGRLSLSEAELDRVLATGCQYLLERHLATQEDLEVIESQGSLKEAKPEEVSEKARQRGRDQLGTLGAGNHFVEIQVVDAIYDDTAAAVFGLHPGQVTVLIHTGSRGLGHQVCTDFVRRMDQAMARYQILLRDRELACAPLHSPEGESYFSAMCAAANFAWANRQAITHEVREVFGRRLGAGCKLRLIYDVAHNIAKLEEYEGELLCVHRKGATRAFGPSHPETPARYRTVGQPVLIPGSMGTASYLLCGTDEAPLRSFGSSCHGAGRAMSRTAAKRSTTGSAVRKELLSRGIVVCCPSNSELAEEAPPAYKDVDRVVDVVHHAGLARKVARLRPVGVIKG